MKVGGNYYFYHNDHLGTPQKMTAVNGAVVWSATYTSFGEANVEVDTVFNNLRFPGQYYDVETGLHYNYHRYYDPGTGRYVKADPLGLKRGYRHLYSYVQNNPIKQIDINGLDISCPDGYHLVTDMAGFSNCMALGPALVFCPVCFTAGYYAPTGIPGFLVGLAACTICFAEEIRCIDKTSRCECGE